MMASEAVDSGARGSIIVGTIVMAAFFVGFGGWAATAPLSSAVIAPAVVKVEGNRKSVQHLEGGIVGQIRVDEGDRVEAGQVLLILDDTEQRGTVERLAKRIAELSAQEARLLAEQAEADVVAFPDTLLGASGDADLARILDAETTLFNTRRAAFAGRVEILRQSISRVREQTMGAEGQLAAQQRQLELIREELRDLEDLFEKGFVPRQRVLDLQRTAAALEGQTTQTTALILQLNQLVQELELRIDQEHAERTEEIADKLSEVGAELGDARPLMRVAEEALERTRIRAPVAGVVVGLTAFTVGGVIAPGERIMEIVPDEGDVTVEAMIDVADQKDVYAGMPADVHMIAYRGRNAPIVRGNVVHVSPDRLTDPRTGAAYYTALVEVSIDEALRANEVRLIPGMPVEVVIPTGERTALDYLLRPLSDSFVRAFREK